MSDQTEKELPVFNPGDKVSIIRGQHRGQQAEILAGAEDGQYAVKTEKGALVVVTAANVRAPAEGTIGAGKLAAEIQTAVNDAQNEDGPDVLQALVSRLEADIPGLGGRITWPAER
jgi:hypothetical protein